MSEPNKPSAKVDWENRWQAEDERLLAASAALWPEWQAMKPSLRRLWVRTYLRGPTGDELINWAAEALSEGLETPSLCILAGLSPKEHVRDARDYLEKSLQELGWSAPPREPTLVMHATDVAAALLADTISVNAAITELYNVMSELNYTRLLSRWYVLDEARFPESYNHMDEVALAAEAKHEATALIDRVRGAIGQDGSAA
jgi:hypothetical protein